jgi:N-acyl-D-amino-acid deacylase
MFPYTAAATTMAAIYPPWALEGGVEALVVRLRDPATRLRMRRDVETIAPSWPPWGEGGWAHNLVRAVGWERITVGTVAGASGRWAEGLDLAALAERSGRDPFEAISDLMVEQEGRVSQIIHGISGEEGSDGGLVALLADPHGAICTDANDTGRGLPHPAAYGTYPRVLGRFVRDRRVLPIEEAVRKMTAYPASILGLADRGVLRRGAAADVVVFDPRTIGSGATFAEPRVIATGVELVIVNGEIVCEGGRLAGVSPGRVIRRV